MVPRLPIAEIYAGLRGALLLARGRVEGIAWMPVGAEGAGRSFWAAAFCLPIFLVMRLLLDAAPGDPSGEAAAIGATLATPRAVVAQLTGYAAGWVAFALAALPMAERMGRGALWPRLVATWNWVNLLQYAILLVFTLLARWLLPVELQPAASLVGIAYALWLQWFAARAALGVGGLQAAGLVFLDLALTLFLAGLVAQLSNG
ncbi:hypothetical protein [Roseomonas sp. 18066]|uniref:hypothetical protein n=1 Tax=Roseomonas sp. 18066 TaxID=2681412 RepID=UPI00135B12F6|nr:hypothetical protein [Roseomonas sp. 18066]